MKFKNYFDQYFYVGFTFNFQKTDISSKPPLISFKRALQIKKN